MLVRQYLKRTNVCPASKRHLRKLAEHFELCPPCGRYDRSKLLATLRPDYDDFPLQLRRVIERPSLSPVHTHHVPTLEIFSALALSRVDPDPTFFPAISTAEEYGLFWEFPFSRQIQWVNTSRTGLSAIVPHLPKYLTHRLTHDFAGPCENTPAGHKCIPCAQISHLPRK